MPINSAARAHGHAYGRSRMAGTVHCVKCSESGTLHLTCRYDDELPRYWVLPTGGYPDTEADYIPAASRDDVYLVNYGYLDLASASVYDGTREPWSEEDPYPDWLVSERPRGHTYVWERA